MQDHFSIGFITSLICEEEQSNRTQQSISRNDKNSIEFGTSTLHFSSITSRKKKKILIRKYITLKEGLIYEVKIIGTCVIMKIELMSCSDMNKRNDSEHMVVNWKLKWVFHIAFGISPKRVRVLSGFTFQYIVGLGVSFLVGLFSDLLW